MNTSQAGRRGFEPRLPLHLINNLVKSNRNRPTFLFSEDMVAPEFGGVCPSLFQAGPETFRQPRAAGPARGGSRRTPPFRARGSAAHPV